MLRYVLLSVCLNACVGEWVIGTPTEPPLAPQVIPSSVTSSSMQVTWPRGDDSKVLHPTEWFEVQYKELGGGTSLLNHQNDWNVVFNGDKVGDAPSPRREGQHEVQVISIRADRGEKITSGYFQLSFSYDGKNYKERYTDSAHSTNDTAVITAPIPWDASASQVSFFFFFSSYYYYFKCVYLLSIISFFYFFLFFFPVHVNILFKYKYIYKGKRST